jgi:hypothetical protein
MFFQPDAGFGVGLGVGFGVGLGVGLGVGFGVGLGVGLGVGPAPGREVGFGDGLGVAAAPGRGVVVGLASDFEFGFGFAMALGLCVDDGFPLDVGAPSADGDGLAPSATSPEWTRVRSLAHALRISALTTVRTANRCQRIAYLRLSMVIQSTWISSVPV